MKTMTWKAPWRHFPVVALLFPQTPASQAGGLTHQGWHGTACHQCECAAGCRTPIKQNRGPQAKNSRAWSTGNLHCIHLTHRHQVLKMQLHSTDEAEFSASDRTQKGNTAATLLAHCRLHQEQLKSQRENSQGNKQHSRHASWSGNTALS